MSQDIIGHKEIQKTSKKTKKTKQKKPQNEINIKHVSMMYSVKCVC